MDDETKASGSEVTMRDYVDMLRRRRAIIIQTFCVVFVVGIIVTFMTKPLYRTTTRILVEGKSVFVSSSIQAIHSGTCSPRMPAIASMSQLEVLEGEQVLNDAYKEAGVKPGTVKIQAKQSGNTDVIEITAESNNQDAAKQVADALPKVYLNYVLGNRSTELDNALKFARDRKADEERKLTAAEQELQQFREKSHVTNVETERTQRITDKVKAEADFRDLDAKVAGLQARVGALQASRKTLTPEVDSPTAVTNPDIRALKSQIDGLQTDRTKLLLTYKPANMEVQKVDTQIRDSIAASPLCLPW